MSNLNNFKKGSNNDILNKANIDEKNKLKELIQDEYLNLCFFLKKVITQICNFYGQKTNEVIKTDNNFIDIYEYKVNLVGYNFVFRSNSEYFIVDDLCISFSSLSIIHLKILLFLLLQHDLQVVKNHLNYRKLIKIIFMQEQDSYNRNYNICNKDYDNISIDVVFNRIFNEYFS